MCTVLSNKPFMLHVSFTYSTWTLFTLPSFNFFFKNFEGRRIFTFCKVLGSIFEFLYISVPYLKVLLFLEYRHWKFLRFYLLFIIMRASFIIDDDEPLKKFYISLARLFKLFWCIGFSLVISRMSWKELT